MVLLQIILIWWRKLSELLWSNLRSFVLEILKSLLRKFLNYLMLVLEENWNAESEIRSSPL